MAVVTHLIVLVSHGVFAFTRLMAVGPALALALILRHLVPLYSAALVCLSGSTPSSRASLIQREAASSQCKRRRSSSAMIALRQQSSARPRYHSALVADMPLKTASNELLIQGPGGAHGAAFCRPPSKAA